MIKTVDVSGSWKFQLDKSKEGVEEKFYSLGFDDTIELPTTTSEAMKGEFHTNRETYFLTDPYQFEGYSWYSKEIAFDTLTTEDEVWLFLERTRISHVWIDDNYVGCCDSLCTSHLHNLTDYITKPIHRLTIMIDNTGYKTKGGHMTSCDTQTNWNGITGRMELHYCKKQKIVDAQISSIIETSTIYVYTKIEGNKGKKLKAVAANESMVYPEVVYDVSGVNELVLTYPMPEADLWSEYDPVTYQLVLKLMDGTTLLDEKKISFGLREFTASGNHFEINGERTLLRGKHDGMIFPMTGYAPTNVEGWLKVMKTAKEYGINHYRFHTCCPPEAAFEAADQLGIYLQPELPFWGTITSPGEEGHNEEEQQYLIQEGFRILKEFGNHPSFVMMSLGNELWGSKEILNNILKEYKDYDRRHLYVQGSNNFQFCPCILEEDDFFSGVRFSRDRLIRGSYAMCDAPQGHIQTDMPNTTHNYDEMIQPKQSIDHESSEDKMIQIQYGTGVKKVKLSDSGELIPNIPVVSHEVGQYAVFPNFREEIKYQGVLKPDNLKVFEERVALTGFLHKAQDYFMASGKLAVDCYKAEIETALRSKELAGFQLLDLQDFSGQGTALVGVLDAFMESKGLISPESFRQFCSDAVLLAEFPSYVVSCQSTFEAKIRLAYYRPISLGDSKLRVRFICGNQIVYSNEVYFTQNELGVTDITNISFVLPDVKQPKKLKLELCIEGTEIKNGYDLWLYPVAPETKENCVVTSSLARACDCLAVGGNVLYLPEVSDNPNSIEGTYCTDFWNYPMFRSISESCKKPVPVGTYGLLINKEHPAFDEFPTDFYSTPQWWKIVMNSRSVILDETIIDPLVQTIDNFERNHRLGMIFEANVDQGKLLVCTSPLHQLRGNVEVDWLYHSLVSYMGSKKFAPKINLHESDFIKLFIQEQKDSAN